MRRILAMCFVCLFALSLLGSTCSKNIRCQTGTDCPGKMICGKAGVCILQCKTKRDCHQDQRCVEGKCEKIQ